MGHSFLKMRATPNIKQASVRKSAHAAFANDSEIHTDGYCSYIPAPEDYTHEYPPYGPVSGLLHWLHIVISNAKAFILGTPKKYPLSYLDEYSFRFSRRDFGGALLERLTLAVSLSRSAEQKGDIYTGIIRSVEVQSAVFPELQIIDPETFERAQKIMADRKSSL